MALIDRLARLVKADIHAIIDNIEDPALLLKQAIREMEQGLADAEQVIASRIRDQKALQGRIEELQQRIDAFNAEIELCFASQKHELVRSLLRKRLNAERAQKYLSIQFATKEERLQEQRDHFLENQATLDSLVQKAAVETRTSGNQPGSDSVFDRFFPASGDSRVADDDVEIAFLHEVEKRSAR